MSWDLLFPYLYIFLYGRFFFSNSNLATNKIWQPISVTRIQNFHINLFCWWLNFFQWNLRISSNSHAIYPTVWHEGKKRKQNKIIKRTIKIINTRFTWFNQKTCVHWQIKRAKSSKSKNSGVPSTAFAKLPSQLTICSL